MFKNFGWPQAFAVASVAVSFTTLAVLAPGIAVAALAVLFVCFVYW